MGIIIFWGTVLVQNLPDSEDGDLPVEVEIYIQPDGTVVFADLAADTVPIAQQLNPDQPLICDVPPDTKRTADDD